MKAHNAEAETKQPETGVHKPSKEGAGNNRCKFQNRRFLRLGSLSVHEDQIKGRAAGDHSQDQKTRAGPAVSECREEASQKKCPTAIVPNCDNVTKPRQGQSSTFWAGLRREKRFRTG